MVAFEVFHYGSQFPLVLFVVCPYLIYLLAATHYNQVLESKVHCFECSLADSCSPCRPICSLFAFYFSIQQNKVWPSLLFPMIAMPCHLPFFENSPSVMIRNCQFELICHKLCLLVAHVHCWSVSLLLLACMYLCIKDLAVSNVSVALGCFPSKVTWFLWNQIHQRVVRTMGRPVHLDIKSHKK